MPATIQALLQRARSRLKTSDSASLDAQMLMCAVLDVARVYLLAHPEQRLTGDQQKHYEALLARREQGEPIAYILGRQAFYDRDLRVSPAVLIPRPETELLLEQALAFAQNRDDLHVVDVGTGSGALAVTFAAHRPSARVLAVDMSTDALDIARQNAEDAGVQVHFMQGDLLEPLITAKISVNLIMANLPYIATDEMRALDVSRYEPHLALDGGPDGLGLIRRLLTQAPQVFLSQGLILLEIGATQGEAMRQLAGKMGQGYRVDVLQDYAGLDRIVRIEGTG